ncbi:phage holin family protein [Corynebacterium uberis]|uniref:phage holin family protein n=1 Tax=Corynebacterium sp. c6VSa_13 TaxID=2913496 RepID=UPI001D09D730|nr:phage holin family protein [Corynebacterium uberis]MCZ9309952.1 phage holin family protein [Corynebacterium sp. c6VSa_13]UDL73129.1 phage holin family protein [Corynebacterium uberis]UDL75994.1 phage holin family protein [Corynebacterium uberis]UDL78206.1 phage holin family protein [Corynebacterium uberis]UDL80489.1 phage holin family protein [Corynebacterium uberis]
MSTASNKDGLYTDTAQNFAPKVNSIPLSDVDASTGNQSIGTLVSNATSQMSTLVRSEIELAKTELATEAKKGAIGGGLFGVAGVIALYSSFFFFIALAEVLAIWLDRWAAYLIVFLVMIVAAGVLALVGFKKVKKIGAPKKTIESAKELKNLVPGSAQKKLESSERGMFS